MKLLPPLSTITNPQDLRDAGFAWRHRLRSDGRILDTFEKENKWQIVLRNPRDKMLTIIAVFSCTFKQMQNYIQQCDLEEQLKIDHLGA